MIETGASRGVGRPTALGLARVNAQVVAVARDEQRLLRLRHELGEAGGGTIDVVARYVRSGETASRAVAQAIERSGDSMRS